MLASALCLIICPDSVSAGGAANAAPAQVKSLAAGSCKASCGSWRTLRGPLFCPGGYNEKKLHFNIGRGLYAAFMTATLSASLCQPASASTVWEKANEIMRDVYTQILGISTIAAIVTAAVALLMMNFSRSGRTVDESRAWLKRIIITWAVLNGLGFIMSYVTPFFSGGQWTAS